MADRKVNIGVGYTLDKSGLEEMQSYFQRIANQAAEPGNKLKAGLQQAGQTAKTLDKILEKTFNTNLGTLNVTKFNQELQKSGLTMKQVQIDLTAIGNNGVIAYNKLAQAILRTNIQLKQSNKLLNDMFTTFKNTIRYGISSSIFNNFTNSVQKAYDYTRKLDTSLNNIRIVTGKSADEMDKFAEKANNAAKELSASTLDITQASLIYYQQGLSDAEVEARAETTVKVANVTGQKADEVSEQLTAVWNGYKVTAAETELYIDKLAAVAATTASDLEELSTGMSKVASAAASMGVDFDDLTAQISTIVSVTRQAPESVGTALKTIYARIGDLKVDGVDEFGTKLGEVSSQLEVMGINILDQEGNMRDMSSIMAEVAEKWQYWTEAQKQAAAVAIAGKRQYNNLIALFENWDMYSDALDTAKNAMGTLQKQQDIYMESTQAKLTKLRATWQDLYKSVGDTKTINGLIDGITNLVEVFDGFVDSFGGGIPSILALGSVLANVFNKQISASIMEATKRSAQLKQNIELLKTTNILSHLGPAEASPGFNSTEANAMQAATEKQLQQTREIYALAGLLSEEQQNQLLTQSGILSNLEADKTERKATVDVLKNQLNLEQSAEDLLKMEEIHIRELTNEENIQKQIEIQREQQAEKYAEDRLAMMEKDLQLEEELNKKKTTGSEIQKNILANRKESMNYSEEEVKILTQDISKYASSNKIKDQIKNNEETILKLLKEQKLADLELEDIDENRLARMKQLQQELLNYKKDEEDINNLEMQQEEILSVGRAAAATNLNVTGVISSLSSLTMAWSSFSTIFDAWSDKEKTFGDKLTQTIMSLTFTVPMLINAFNSLKKAHESYLVIKSRDALVSEFLSKATKQEIAEDGAVVLTIAGVNGAKDRKIKVTQAEIAANNKLIYSEKGVDGVYLKEAASAGILTKAKAKLVSLGTALKGGFSWLLKFLGTTMGAITAIAGAAVVSGIILVKWYKKEQERRLEAAQAIVDENSKKQEEIKTNKELAQSYDDIYKKYKNNAATKEEVGKVAEQLAEKYKIEGLELATLTGDYEDFTKALKEARKEELQSGIKSNIEAEKGYAEKVKQTAKKAKGGRLIDNLGEGYDRYRADLASDSLDSEWSQALIAGASEYYSNGVFEVSNIDDPKKMLDFYNKVKKTFDEFQGEKDDGYKTTQEWLSQMQTVVEETNQLYIERQGLLQDTAWEDIDINNVGEDIDTVSEKINQLRSAFNVVNGDAKEGGKQLQKYLATSSNETAKYIGTVKAQLEKSNVLNFDELFGNTSKGITGVLSKAEKEFAVNNKIDFSSMINYDTDQVLEILKTKMHQIDKEDLTTVVSLRAKITSDKKLTKKEIEESLNEQSQLLKDERYAADFADFDNKSSLEQLELLNNIIADKINLNKEWEQSTKEAYSTMIEQEKIYQEKLEKRRDELNQALSQAKTDEQIKTLQLELARVNAEIDQSNQKIVEFEKNMSQVQLNEVRFDNLIAGIDGVIDEVKTLKGLTDAIGEGWVVAADKLETFAKNFPELMADQKNYNYLQDGSLHLTEEGQEAFKAQLEARKQEIILQNESYQRELQITADKKLAEYEYYKNMADHLERYAKGYESEAELEGNLKRGLEEYKVRLMNATGVKDEELNKIIQENNNKTADNTIDNVHNMFNAYQQLGAAMLACQTGAPVPNWSDNKASAPKVDTVGHELTFDVDFLEPKLSKEDAEKMAKMAREAADLVYNEYSTAISKKVAADGQTNALLASLDNLGARKKGKDKKQEEFDDEFDRYYDIKKAIDLVNNALDRLSKIQEKLHGKELIQSLKNENNLIKQQAQNYETLYAQQKVELNEIQGSLMNFGAEFDNNGFLTNYASLTASALEQYQSEIDKYNAGLITEEAKDAYEKSYEKMKKYLDRYDSLFYNEMKDTQDKLDEYNRQTMENNLKIWETEIQIKLDTSQAERDWMDFLKEINNDFRKVYKNLNIEMDHFVAKMETYSGMNTIETDLQAIKDVMVEIDKINSGKTSSMFESVSDAQEKLKELDQQLETDAKDMKQLWQDAWDAYLEGIDQSNDKLEFMNDRFEKINEELEFQGRLIELLYGEEAYSLMDKLYKGQEVAAQNNISSIKTQADLWHQLWEESGATLQNQADWTSDQEKYYENWQEQQSKLNDLVTSYIELLQKDYLNTVNDVLAQLEKAMTGGNTLEDIKDQWDKITAYSDKYYDGIEHALEVQKFANKIDADISKTVGIKNQQKLEAIREKEITYLREKKNLTKYDMEAAEARYQIALKEIALEEAQQNKTSMKLVRNEEGNWAYQYMADADDVAQKQDDLLTSYGDLYRLAGDAYQNNLEEMQSLEEQYLESQRKIYEDLYMSDEEKTQRLVELGEWYQETMNRLAEENELYRQDLRVAGAGTLLQVYNQDQEAYEFMTAAEQAMLDSLIGASISSYQELEVRCAENYNHIQEASAHAMTLIREDWTSSAQQIADTWAADDGQSVMSQVTWAQEQIGQATLDYQTLVDECASQVERDFGPDGVSGSINEAAQETHDLQDAIAELCDTSKTQLESLKKTLGQVELAWMAQKNKISEAIEEVKRYIAIIGKANQVAAKSYGVTNGAGNIGDFDINGNETGGGSGTSDGLFDFAAGDYVIMGRDGYANNRIVTISNNNGKGFKEEDLAAAAAKFKIKESPEITEVKKVPKWLEENIFKDQKWKVGAEDFAFRTGGYTGEWGEDGRLAVLHQKELVLNANDTANFLNGISLLRDMVSLNGSIEKSIAAAIGGMAMQLGGMSASKISTGNSQAAPALAGDTYYVTADFPNANNAEEIKQAILNLPNIVSQALGKDNI